MCLQQDRKASVTQLGRAGRLEYFHMWANELKALLKMLDVFWMKLLGLWISNRVKETSVQPTEAAGDESAATLTCFRDTQESPSQTQRHLCKVGLSGHRAGEHSTEKGCWVAMKVHALPLLLLLSFFQLLGDQQILLPLHSLESIWVGLPLMLPVAQGPLPLVGFHLFLLVPDWRLRLLRSQERSSTEILGKRRKICKSSRESRVQLLQRIVKAGKQNFCWKICKCRSPCTAFSPPLCPYQHCSVLSLIDCTAEPCSKAASAEELLPL